MRIDTGRAQRRHDNERLKVVRSRHMLVAEHDGSRPSDKRIGKHLNTAAMCSCHMCGNPRKFFGEPTMQERRHLQLPQEYLEAA